MKRLLLLSLLLLPTQLFAQDDLSQALWSDNIGESDKKDGDAKEPLMTNRLVFDVNSDNQYSATNSRDQYIDTKATAFFTSKVRLGENFSIKSNLRMERANKVSEDDKRKSSVNGGGNRTFENEEIFYLKMWGLPYLDE